MLGFRRRQRLRALDEVQAYHRCHGERSEVRIVHLEPRRPRADDFRVRGESLRQAFEARLDSREPPHGEPHATAPTASA